MEGNRPFFGGGAGITTMNLRNAILLGIALEVFLAANHASAQIIYPQTQQQLIQSCYASRFALNLNASAAKGYAYCVCWAAVMSRRFYRQTTKTEQQTLSTSTEVCDQELR